jgi:hypothetical protein
VRIGGRPIDTQVIEFAEKQGADFTAVTGSGGGLGEVQGRWGKKK